MSRAMLEYTYIRSGRKARRRTDDCDSNIAAFLRINGIDEHDADTVRECLDEHDEVLLVGSHGYIVEIEVTR